MRRMWIMCISIRLNMVWLGQYAIGHIRHSTDWSRRGFTRWIGRMVARRRLCRLRIEIRLHTLHIFAIGVRRNAARLRPTGLNAIGQHIKNRGRSRESFKRHIAERLDSELFFLHRHHALRDQNLARLRVAA